MAIPILHFWKQYYENPDEGLGSSYERVVIERKMLQVCRLFHAESVLEAPSFGFTGMSGINSMGLAKAGFEVTLVDHDPERVQLIESLWKRLELPLKTTLLNEYESLPYTDRKFDVSWNFSALWFVNDLPAFLGELTRVTRKAIVLMTPNRSGLGYFSQKLQGAEDLRNLLREEFIDPALYRSIMRELGWEMIASDYIDCPPWPDIGMHKEKFLARFGIRLPEKPRQPLTILNWYDGSDPSFPERMARHEWFERCAPSVLKHFWAHHRYHVFVPKP
jgi:SAM-dependent methyltransferase